MSNINFEDLKEKVCVLTGGAGIIGSALAHGLASAGIRTAILDIQGEKAKMLADQIETDWKSITRGYQGNVLDRSALEDVKRQIHQDLGPIDYLINAAGGNAPKATTQLENLETSGLDDMEQSFFGLDPEGFQWVFDLNFKGTLIPSMVFMPDMVKKQKGAVINISSMASYRPLTKIPAYSAAKASVNNFTQWLSVHMAKVGIRVNAIAPGFFLTRQNHFLLVDEATGRPTPRGKKIIDNTPLGRYGEVEEIQGTVLYLLSDLSRFVTGICIPVDGGYSAYGGV